MACLALCIVALQHCSIFSVFAGVYRLGDFAVLCALHLNLFGRSGLRSFPRHIGPKFAK